MGKDDTDPQTEQIRPGSRVYLGTFLETVFLIDRIGYSRAWCHDGADLEIFPYMLAKITPIKSLQDQ